MFRFSDKIGLGGGQADETGKREPFLKVVWSERGEKLDAVVVAVAEVWTT